ncbi:NAD(P)/FAD-dependent oxidoreductase [Litoribacter alkaliphilus]|uniref:NAD(P)/FAD-dependent oxidoreductase n=1 Tax=Litoribacter ruber TaxID=702568 RepID=A0AAP2CKR9_9BACT|nr:NAD(P)/FAD-dependent oxidoreductase [Litoribacter alkaliphilus]MBS9525579.1 NAD(P)/FAD-dependent oxidoreductase [Litoribacter alkaliphilus]
MHKDIIIVGAGHYGIMAAYFLKDKANIVVLERNLQVGDAWRSRFDSMQLFTPSAMASLPSLPMALEAEARPTKDQMGDYLDRYVDHFQLPVYTNHFVSQIRFEDGVFEVVSSNGTFTADQVIMANGNSLNPKKPQWVHDLAIPALHVRKYKNPVSVKGKKVLVSANGNSGAQIAAELSKYFDVTWAKSKRGKASLSILGKNRFWWGNKLNKKDVVDGKENPIFYFDKLASKMKKVKIKPEIEAVTGNEVKFSNGTSDTFDFVIYSDGYSPDFRMIQIEGFDTNVDKIRSQDGQSNIPKMHFLGVPYQRERFPFIAKFQEKDVQNLLQKIKG